MVRYCSFRNRLICSVSPWLAQHFLWWHSFTNYFWVTKNRLLMCCCHWPQCLCPSSLWCVSMWTVAWENRVSLKLPLQWTTPQISLQQHHPFTRWTTTPKGRCTQAYTHAQIKPLVFPLGHLLKHSSFYHGCLTSLLSMLRQTGHRPPPASVSHFLRIYR